MKEVMAVIRMNKINQTKNALLVSGFPSITCRKVMGRGKKKVDFTLVQNIFSETVKEAPNLVEAISEGHRLVPKRFLTLIVQDHEVKKVIDTIMEVNSTGNPGDGKLFILPVMEAYRISTGETGENAV